MSGRLNIESVGNFTCYRDINGYVFFIYGRRDNKQTSIELLDARIGRLPRPKPTIQIKSQGDRPKI